MPHGALETEQVSKCSPIRPHLWQGRRGLELIIIHYHLRPGGVRRVIEMAVPLILRAQAGFRSVILAAGEAPEDRWLKEFRTLADPTNVEFHLIPAFAYDSEQRGRLARRERAVAAGVKQLLQNASPEDTLVWAHNLGLGRNLPLTREVVSACSHAHLPLLLHHHDWWFENRWQRWLELQRAGFRTPAQIAETIFPPATTIRHATINRADEKILQRHFPGRVSWLPNPVERGRPVSPERKLAARRWLQARIGGDSPAWTVPCRLLRRKNLAEALLLTRWLRPEALLVTTGGVSSADEAAYARRLREAAQQFGWPLRLGILGEGDRRSPSVPELLAASEAVLLTSVQEGFGLPNLEAAAAGRPLITRNLANIAPDLAELGFTFPQSYEEILVAPELFDRPAELRRQGALHAAWLKQLPRSLRSLAGTPALLLRGAQPGPVPFSRLTLEAQIEILAHRAEDSWAMCSPLNPSLRRWKRRASAGTLRVSPWPVKADSGGSDYADQILRTSSGGSSSQADARRAQRDFLCERLKTDWLYPLLWDFLN